MFAAMLAFLSFSELLHYLSPLFVKLLYVLLFEIAVKNMMHHAITHVAMVTWNGHNVCNLHWVVPSYINLTMDCEENSTNSVHKKVYINIITINVILPYQVNY